MASFVIAKVAIAATIPKAQLSSLDSKSITEAATTAVIASEVVTKVAMILIRKFAGVTASWTEVAWFRAGPGATASSTAVAWFRAGPGATTLSQPGLLLTALDFVKAQMGTEAQLGC